MQIIGISWMDAAAVLCAVLLCGLIGFEREARRKDAGIRTHILVGLGSCLFTMVSIEGVPMLLGQGVTWDASRIAAQVVTGIGFLGAGVICFANDTVRGLTTACAIWIAAAVGVACGAGMLPLAALVTAMYFLGGACRGAARHMGVAARPGLHAAHDLRGWQGSVARNAAACRQPGVQHANRRDAHASRRRLERRERGDPPQRRLEADA